MSLKIDVFIVSWAGQHANASKIAKATHGKVSRVTIIFSDNNDDVSIGEGRWIRVPNEHFGGKKFEKCLGEFDGDIMLTITADAHCHNWASLIRSCEQAFTHNKTIGVWAPNVNYSPLNLEITSVSTIEGTPLHLVTQTDSIVWALSKDTVSRLKSLDYTINNLGWGIDTLACVYCHSTKRLVTVDAETTVFHPLATGYDQAYAKWQQAAFWTQMTPQEGYHFDIIQDYMKRRRASLDSAGSDWRIAIKQDAPCPCGSGKPFSHCHGAFH